MLIFPLLLQLNGQYSRLIYRCFIMLLGLRLFLGYYRRHLWSHNPVHTCIRNCLWRDVLETVINSRKLTDAQVNPSIQRKRYISLIWQITLNFTDKEQLYALSKIKEKKHILNQTHHMNRSLTNKLT